MHDMSIFWLRVAAALYSLGLIHAVVFLLRKDGRSFRYAFPAFTVGLVLHGVALIELGVGIGHLPVDNFYQTISACGFLIGLLFFFAHWHYQFSSLGIALFPLVFLMTFIGATEVPVSSWSDPRVRSAWLLIHVLLILIGYAALLLMAAGSVFYLIQERQIKSKRPRAFFDKLPPLATLDRLITRSMAFGFVFITLGVITGSTWAFIESGTSWIVEPQVAISLVTWAFYLVMVFLRMTAGWRGRKAAVMALAVVGCSALTWATHAGLRRLLVQ